MAISVGKEDGASRTSADSSSAPQNGKFSLSLGSRKPLAASTISFKQPAKRPRALLEEEDHDRSATASQRSESILTFGLPTAGAAEAAESPRVIQSLPNRDWREESKKKRQTSNLPRDPRNGANTNISHVDIINATTPAFGLTVVQPPSLDKPTSAPTTTLTPLPTTSTPPPPPLTADEAALLALTAGPTTSTHTIRPPTPPTIQTEDSAFRTAYTSAPRMASLDEYTATPVEGFGAAILRGYLAPGETLEKRAERATVLKERVRRPGLLGIGAKETAQGLDGVELGAWGRGVKKGKGGKKEEVGYLPLQVRSKITGEVMGEEEMKRRVEAGKMILEEKGRGQTRLRREEDGEGRRRLIGDVNRGEGWRESERDDRRRRADDGDRGSREERLSRKEADASYRSRRDEADSIGRRRRYDDDDDDDANDRYNSRDKERGNRRENREADGERDSYRDRERERRPPRDEDDSRRRDRDRDRDRDGRNRDKRNNGGRRH